MSKPDDIPADIWDACSELASQPRAIGEFFQKNYIEPIARLVAAERERCAGIAEEDLRTAKAIEHVYKPTWFVRAEEIAAAIRKGKT